MNLITTAIRNRLMAQKSIKLIYIHMNQRVLDANTTFQDWSEGDDDLQLELENILVQMEEDGDDAEILGEVEDIEIDDDEVDITHNDDVFIEGAGAQVDFKWHFTDFLMSLLSLRIIIDQIDCDDELVIEGSANFSFSGLISDKSLVSLRAG